MALTESLRFLITSDSAQARGDLAKLNQQTGTTMSGLDKLKETFKGGLGIGAGVGFADAAISGLSQVGRFALAQAQQAIGAASNLQQSQGAVKAIFRESSAEVEAFGRKAAETVGLSSAAFQQQAATLGALLQNLGQTREQSAQTSQQLIQTGADLAATFGGTTADAVAAIGSALRGERDPIERYGVSIKEAAVQQKALELGLAATAAELTDAQKATATLALIQQQASSSAGAFARESDTLAGQQQRLNAELENLRAELGAALIPAMTELVQVARGGIGVLGDVAANIRFIAGEADKALGPVDEFIAQIAKLPSLRIPRLSGDGGFEDVNDDLRKLQDTLRGLGVDLEETFDTQTPQQLQALSKAFQSSGLSALEFIRTIADDRLEQLPPALAEIVRGLLGIESAAGAAAPSLAELRKQAGALSDAIFGTDNKASAFAKSFDTAGASAGRTAKQLEQANRRIADASRNLADARTELQEAEVQRFLTSLGASSDEITLAQIAERDSTRDLADAKRNLADAQERLTKLRQVDQASLLDAEAANIEAQRAVVEAERSGDAVALKRARADLIRTEEALNKARDPGTAEELAKAEQDVAEAQDAVTKAEIDAKTSRQELNDLINRGRDGSKELAEANKAVEDAQRKVEDAQYALIDAQDALNGSTATLAGTTKDAGDQFERSQKLADAWLLDLIDKKKTPEEFAAAVDEIRQRLSGVAKEAGKTEELEAYLAKMQELRDKILAVDDAAGKATVKLGSIPGLVGSSGGIGASTGVSSTVTLNVDGKRFGEVVVNGLIAWSNDNGPVPIRVR
jgi:chromosome segregation ATPase